MNAYSGVSARASLVNFGRQVLSFVLRGLGEGGLIRYAAVRDAEAIHMPAAGKIGKKRKFLEIAIETSSRTLPVVPHGIGMAPVKCGTS